MFGEGREVAEKLSAEIFQCLWAIQHKICQAKVHAVFTETELKTYYHTVDRLKEHDDIAKFIKWVSKKELEFFDTTIKKK